ncbi:MAG: hypothetical protein HY586_06090 [Candidatus Omnitrophica bacterium]|nr:hypothetical protein [Candidatus Omnitrophota bacterium]
MRKKFSSNDPYRQVIQALNRVGVQYVVVGMSGINYYAKNAAETFGTMDYDIFIQPKEPNVIKTIKAVQELDCTLSTSAGAFKLNQLKKLLTQYNTLIASTPYGMMIEFLLKISGYSFSELFEDAKTFDLDGVPVRVGRLTKLLDSKRIANRTQDRQFLKRYKALFE